MKSAVGALAFPTVVVDLSGLTLSWLKDQSGQKDTCGQVLEEEIITRAPERAPDVRLDARPVNSESRFVNAVDHFHPEGMGGGGRSRAQSG